MIEKLTLPDEVWRQRLSPDAYAVLRQHGTERAWAGCFVGTKEAGIYACAGCHQPLFPSNTKFESGTGWPSFTAPLTAEAVAYYEDNSYGMRRVEVRCGRCDGHLGHVFDDGPPPTGKRFCMNSISMVHVPEGTTLPLVTAE